MEFEFENMEKVIFDLLDQVKVLISQEIWDNILMDCTKNELLIFILLYRQTDVNMSQIAEYLNAPLNTTTGIVSRMEKRDLVTRVRSEADKRIVTIVLTSRGKEQIGEIMKSFIHYGQRIIEVLEPEEFTLMVKVFGKVVSVLQESPKEQENTRKKVRKITIN